MIFEKATQSLGLFRTLIQIAGCLLIGTMMVFFAGLPLVQGGIASGYVPLGIGICALITAARKVLGLIR